MSCSCRSVLKSIRLVTANPALTQQQPCKCAKAPMVKCYSHGYIYAKRAS